MKKELAARMRAIENELENLNAQAKAIAARSDELKQEVRAIREEMKASPRPSPKGKGEKPCEMKQTRHPADGLNDKAWGLMEKARNGGLLDAEYMPTGTRAEAALLAGAIAQDAEMLYPWKAFETLWNIRYLRMSAYKATYLKNYPNIIRNIDAILSA